MVIHKYRIPFMETATVVMPKGSNILRVDGLDGALWCWAAVNPEAPLVEKTFYLVKTGGELPKGVEAKHYVGCGAIFIQMELMMYIFEVPNTEKPAAELPAPFDWRAVQEK